MSYTLQAVIGDEAMLRANCPKESVVVPLTQGKAMIPICDELLEQAEMPFLPLTDEGQKELDNSTIEFISPLVGRGKFAYVEAEFFGGDGTQACVCWDEKGLLSDPLVDVNAINTALKFLDVRVEHFRDEFEALSLGKHRNTRDWLEDVKL